MTTQKLEIALQKSKKEDEDFLKFTSNYPVGSLIQFEDFDGGFEISVFDGIILEYNFDKKEIYVEEPNSVGKYKHWISFNDIK